MSKLRLYGDTSGFVELAAPDVSDDGVLVLPTAAQGFGKVLQVVQTVKTDGFSTTSTSLTNITGLSASITPVSAANKVVVLLTIGTVDGSTTNIIYGDVTRDASPIGIGDASGSRGRAGWGTNASTTDRPTSVSWSFLDSPATASSTTYQARMRAQTGTVYVNRLHTNTDSAAYFTAVSTLTLVEIAA
jgi:hypothetical protein